MIRIHHYSERGLVNSWINSVRSAQDPLATLLATLKPAVLCDEHGCTGLPLNGTPQRAEIYVEPSLSEFGNPDVVIILHGESPKNKVVLFVEAKLCPFQESAPSHKPQDELAFQKNSRSVLHELYMKAVLHRNLQEKKEDFKSAVVYLADKQKGKSRKIGNDPQVKQLAREITDALPCFVALTTDLPPANGSDGWHGGKAISDLLHKISETIARVDDSNPFCCTPGYFDELTYMLSWHSLYELADTLHLTELKAAFEENRQKFVHVEVGPAELDAEMMRALEQLLNAQGLEVSKDRKTRRMTAYLKRPRRAVLACSVRRTFTGHGLHVYWVAESRQKKYPCTTSYDWPDLQSQAPKDIAEAVALTMEGPKESPSPS